MAKLIVDAFVLIDSFQAGSIHRAPAIAFIEHCVQTRQVINIPAHGWFEFWCNVNRVSELDRTYLPPAFAGKMRLLVEVTHIDEQFILKYGNVRLPYARASDHIYLVVAFVNKYTLVTRDARMGLVARKVDVPVFTPAEFMADLAALHTPRASEVSNE